MCQKRFPGLRYKRSSDKIPFELLILLELGEAARARIRFGYVELPVLPAWRPTSHLRHYPRRSDDAHFASSILFDEEIDSIRLEFLVSQK